MCQRVEGLCLFSDEGGGGDALVSMCLSWIDRNIVIYGKTCLADMENVGMFAAFR